MYMVTPLESNFFFVFKDTLDNEYFDFRGKLYKPDSDITKEFNFVSVGQTDRYYILAFCEVEENKEVLSAGWVHLNSWPGQWHFTLESGYIDEDMWFPVYSDIVTVEELENMIYVYGE